MCRGNYETQDNRIALEKKSKEFKKAGKILINLIPLDRNNSVKLVKVQEK